MSVCFFNKDYNHKYYCEYVIDDDSIMVTVRYDITLEIPYEEKGVKSFSFMQTFDDRDIIIVEDSPLKCFYLKNAYYIGSTRKFGRFESYSETCFKSFYYFENNSFESLISLPDVPKIESISIVSSCFNKLSVIEGFSLEKLDKEYLLHWKIKPEKKVVQIKKYNIESLGFSSSWKCNRDSDLLNFSLDFIGKLDIQFIRRVNFDVLTEYINELVTYMQLYVPGVFLIDRIEAKVNDVDIIINIPYRKTILRDKDIVPSVKTNLLEFLYKCYINIPYRAGKSENRNISYIVLNEYRSIEDNFLMYYRFIENYYKKQNIQDIRNNFISYSIIHNYPNNRFSEAEVENISAQIVSLRNKYVHSGYHLRNNCLRVKFSKKNNDAGFVNYTENNITARWIFERVNILYKIVIDIIFKEMLDYSDYRYRNR